MEQTPTITAESPSLLIRFSRLFTSPREAFAPPRTRRFWLVPLLVLLVSSVLQSLALEKVALEWVRGAVEEMTFFQDAQRDQILESTDVPATLGSRIIQVVRDSCIVVLVGILLPAVCYLLGINFVIGGRATFRDIFGVQAFSSMAIVLRELVTLPLKLSQQTLAVHTSPAAFFDRSAGALFHIAGRLDVFVLFQLFIASVGLSVVGNVPVQRSAAAVLTFWILGSILVVLVRLSPIGPFFP